MPAARIPENEAERLKALAHLLVLDTPPEPAFDAIVRIAATATDAPMAAISFVDKDRQWFKAKVGIEDDTTHRDNAFCAYAILEDRPLIIPDADADPRFSDNPVVTGPDGVKSYLSAPLNAGGLLVGTVCVVDTTPRQWEARHVAQIEALAHLVMELLQNRQRAIEVERLSTEVLKLNARLEIGNALFEEVSQVANVGGWQIDVKTGRLVWTRQTARIYGVPENETLAVPEALAFYAPEARPIIAAALERAITEGEAWSLELPFDNRQGRRIWVRAVGKAIIEGGKPIRLVGAFQDITEQRDREHALAEAVAHAQAATEAKSAFLANMSHEIRTPLNGVLGLAGALASTELSEVQREMVSLIRASGETLERVVSDILDMSKIEAGKLDLALESFDLCEAVKVASQVMEVRAQEKGIRFEIEHGPDARGYFQGDVVRVRQIISNLASNAVKFTEQGGVRIRVEVEDGADDAPSLVRVIVADTGIGFDGETARRLFARFEQADASITRSFGGTGLGLSICRALTTMMGGSIQAQSEPGVGSRFTVELPLHRVMPLADYDAQASAETSVFAAKPSIALSGASARVLLAEDHPTNQRVVSLILAPHDIELTIVSNGREAVEAVRAAGFDLVLMDMQMPEMDGLSATRAIRAWEAGTGRRTPIAMLSANAMSEHVTQALAAGCDLHISKPVTPDALLRGIELALALARPSLDALDVAAN